MYPVITPHTILLGVWLVSMLLALCGKLPLITSLLSGSTAFILLVYFLHIGQTSSIIIAVLMWFILWRIGSAIHKHGKKKAQSRPQNAVHASNEQKSPRTARAAAPLDTAEVKVLVDRTVEITGWLLDAGHGASIITNGDYEGSILISPYQEKNDSRWKIAVAMIATPDLVQAQNTFFAKYPDTVRKHPEIFKPLCWFTKNYAPHYLPEDRMYLLATAEAAQLPKGYTGEDLRALCMQEILKRCPLAIQASDRILHTKGIAR